MVGSFGKLTNSGFFQATDHTLNPSAVSLRDRLPKLQAWLEKKKSVIQYLLLLLPINTFYFTHPHYQTI